MKLGPVSLIAAVAVLTACGDKTPARIDFSAPMLKTFTREPVAVGARLVNASGQTLAEPALTYSATPTSVLSASPEGQLRCVASGEGTVVVAGGGQSATLTVLCQLAATIRGPSDARLILARPPEPVAFNALNESGVAIADAPVEVTSSDPRIVRYERGALVAVGVGHATVTAKLGGASSATEVSVVELVESKPLVLNDGASTTWTLQQGKYELDIKVKAEGGSSNGVTVTWIGTDCPSAKESQDHHLFCDVAQTASLTVLNPTALGLGPSVTGFFNLYRTAK